MKFVGEKSRFAKDIAKVLRDYVDHETVYVEPFCGGCGIASVIAKELKPKTMLLSDNNPALIDLWKRVCDEGMSFFPQNAEDVIRDYPRYKLQKDMDALTALYGHFYSANGKWFSGVPGEEEDVKKAMAKAFKDILNVRHALQNCEDVRFSTFEYWEMAIPENAVVLLDPPSNKTKKAYLAGHFDEDAFWTWARGVSRQNPVFITSVTSPDDFEEVYSWNATSGGLVMRLVKYAPADEPASDFRLRHIVRQKDIEGILKDLNGEERFDLLPKSALVDIVHHAEASIVDGRLLGMESTSEELLLKVCDCMRSQEIVAAAYFLLMAIWHENKKKRV